METQRARGFLRLSLVVYDDDDDDGKGFSLSPHTVFIQ